MASCAATAWAMGGHLWLAIVYVALTALNCWLVFCAARDAVRCSNLDGYRRGLDQ